MYSCSIDINRQTKTIRSEKRRCRYIFSVTCLKNCKDICNSSRWVLDSSFVFGTQHFFFYKICKSGQQNLYKWSHVPGIESDQEVKSISSTSQGQINSDLLQRPSWLWSYGSWIYNYLCNQCLSPLKLWVRTLFMARCTWYNIRWSSLSVTCDRSVVWNISWSQIRKN
jgi:hypothetical protein